jgi:hypothetical protein
MFKSFRITTISIFILALLFLAFGYWGRWISHPVAGLNILGVDLPEYVKFVPEVRNGVIPVNRMVFFAMPVVLALGLSACPGMAPFPGVLGVYIHPIGSERCDDGVKVVLEGIEESWDLIGPYLGGGVRNQGDYWIWVEPDVESQMSWDVPPNSPAAKQPEGKQITVKAYCMRTDAPPGLSERSFALSDFIVVRGLVRRNSLEMRLDVSDSGSDPDYTVTPPGLVIE